MFFVVKGNIGMVVGSSIVVGSKGNVVGIKNNLKLV